jgi:hypothetical protein
MFFSIDNWSFSSHQGLLMTTSQIADMKLPFPAPTMPFDSHVVVKCGDVVVLDLYTASLLQSVSMERPPYSVSVLNEFWAGSSVKCPVVFDWSYTPTMPADLDATADDYNPCIKDRDRLSDKGVPILHYCNVDFYEDEVADLGAVRVGVRVRVMPFGWIGLLRHHLRVDGVVMRDVEWRFVGYFGENVMFTIVQGGNGHQCITKRSIKPRSTTQFS